MTETPRPLTPSELDAFEAIAKGLDTHPTCMCQREHQQVTSDGVLPYCGKPAVVKAEIHLVHICRHPSLLSTGKVNQLGNAVQFFCAACLEECRVYTDAKIAQTRARCTELSTSCRRCGNGLAVRDNGQIILLGHCPACGFARMQFDPSCGAGVWDQSGHQYGCGAPLNNHSDVIRSIEWLDGQ